MEIMNKKHILDDDLRKDLEQYLNAHMKNRIICALYRSEKVYDYTDLKYCVENNVKIEGLSKHYGMKFLKDFCNQKDNKKEEKVVDYIDENKERKNIINSYINLIKEKVDRIEHLINARDETSDDDLYRLSAIYEKIKDCYYV